MSADNAPQSNAITTHHIEMFMKMMVEYRIDEFQLGGIKIVKRYHDIPEAKADSPRTTQPISDDEALFYSAQ